MSRSGNAVSSYSDLNPSETLVQKKRGIALNDCEKEEFDSPTIGCFLYRTFLHVIWSMPTNSPLEIRSGSESRLLFPSLLILKFVWVLTKENDISDHSWASFFFSIISDV